MATLVAWWARLAAYTRRHEQAGARGRRKWRFAGLSTFDWYKLLSWRLEGLKTKKCVKFGYIGKKPYLCTVLVAERYGVITRQSPCAAALSAASWPLVVHRWLLALSYIDT